MSCRKKLLLVLGVEAQQRQKSPLFGWLRSFVIFLALVQHCLLEVRELRAIGVLVCSHSPLESPHILYGAVPKLGGAGAEVPYHLRRQVKVAEALHQGVHVT